MGIYLLYDVHIGDCKMLNTKKRANLTSEMQKAVISLSPQAWHYFCTYIYMYVYSIDILFCTHALSLLRASMFPGCLTWTRGVHPRWCGSEFLYHRGRTRSWVQCQPHTSDTAGGHLSSSDAVKVNKKVNKSFLYTAKHILWSILIMCCRYSSK